MPQITKLKKTIKPKKKTATPKKKKVKIVKTETVEKKKNEVRKRKDFISAIGRRKRAIARVRYYQKGENEIIINSQPLDKYFPHFELNKIVKEPINLTKVANTGKFSIKVLGGGKRGQAESIRLGISRIILLIDNSIKPLLKSKKLLVRDSRVKERKKYGLRKARRAPQWQKR